MKRHITLLYPDGHSAANAEITISIYLWNNNHCAFHMALPLGVFRTDKTGTIEVLAPLVELYFDGLFYYGSGPAGIAYSRNSGLELGPEQNLVVKEAWQFTPDDSLTDQYELRVLTLDGRPRSDVDVFVSRRSNTCGGGDRIGQTDSKGIVQMDLDPSITGLELRKMNDELRQLTDGELRTLFSKHKLVIPSTSCSAYPQLHPALAD